MFCDCGSAKIPKSDKYCQCVKLEYIPKLEKFLDLRFAKAKDKSDTWREDLEVSSKVDALDSVNKWYTATVINSDGSNRVRISYDGWSSRYDEWISRHDARLQPYRSRAIGGRESGGVPGTVDQKGVPPTVGQLSIIVLLFTLFL